MVSSSPEYDALLDKADAITANDQIEKRYEAYADAEAWLAANALQIPVQAFGATPRVSKEVPFTRQFSWVGLANQKYKNLKLQGDAVTIKQYDKALKDWEAKKVETAKENTSNQK